MLLYYHEIKYVFSPHKWLFFLTATNAAIRKGTFQDEFGKIGQGEEVKLCGAVRFYFSVVSKFSSEY